MRGGGGNKAYVLEELVVDDRTLQAGEDEAIAKEVGVLGPQVVFVLRLLRERNVSHWSGAGSCN